MSQVLKKPGNLPMRKRLKPTVNLNVASRRRKDTKDTSSAVDVAADVLTEPPKTKCLSNSTTTKENFDSQGSNVAVPSANVKNILNKTFESEKSFSSLPTVVLEDERDDNEIDKALENLSLSRENSKRSVTSSVSTVLLSNSKQSTNNNLNLSTDSLDQLNEIDTSNVTINASPRTVSCAVESFDTKQKELENQKDDPGDAVVSNVSVAEPSINGDGNNTETLSHCSGNKSKDESCNEHTILPQNEKNVDAGSLNDDSVSCVSESSSVSQNLDGSLPKYKRKVSDTAKRLSEARREFESRFCNKKPDRNKLRMLDLIYYNPSTNPMKQASENPKEISINSPPNRLNSSDVVEEEIDDPDEEENLNEDNDNGIPAPRVKVGPNGEIVLDEQSLVIETTQSKKSKQEMANLTVVVDTGSNTSYHTYSKKKRIRNDWDVKETVRFYKALQTLGTDFSLMQTLFPSRTRVDLKSKFKKEERINGHLIEKALRFPSLFDLSELEKEPEIEKKGTGAKEKKNYKPRVKKRSLKSLGFDEEDSGPMLKKKRRKQVVETSRSEEPDKNTEKENVESFHEDTSDEEYHPPAEHQEKTDHSVERTEVQVPRARRNVRDKVLNYAALENKNDFLEAGVDLLESSENEEENVPEIENVVCGDNIQVIDSSFDMNNVLPGSLVVVTTQCPNNPGYQICNVFMVQERTNTNSVCEETPSTSDLLSIQANTSDASVSNSECIDEPS